MKRDSVIIPCYENKPEIIQQAADVLVRQILANVDVNSAQRVVLIYEITPEEKQK